MKKSLIWAFFMSVMMLVGCDENTLPPAADTTPHDPVPADIFPLTKGHQYEFGGYLTSGSSETKVPGSESLSATWTILGDTALTSVFAGPMVSHLSVSSASLIFDQLNVPGIQSTKTTPVFIYRDQSNGDYYYLTNFGNFFRSYAIYAAGTEKIRGDSLRFIKLSAGSAKLNTPFTVFLETFQSNFFGPTAIALKLEIIGNYEQKTGVSLNLNGKDTTITSYYLTVTNSASLGSVSPQRSVNAKFWLAPGIGPVQFFLAGDSEAPGSVRKLTKKNF
jgi:hypothetical protein